MRKLTGLGLLGMLLVAVGCTPTTKIKSPLSVRPVAQRVAAVDNGSIFQASASRPLFEDRRARGVGDVLTITIAEATTATEKSSTNAASSGSLNVVLPSFPQVQGFGGSTTTGSNAVKSGSSSDNAGNNAFSGTITVTVIEVLDNGNLLVSGEKLVTVKYANEYVRFYGVVNPNTISASNTVLSTQVADMRIEYKNANNIDSAAVSTMFSRFFLAILPF
ncbi:MAG: flagellar basal body L-ring protein FlgH [Gallionellaceae bacterium]|nr:MAG: flagellar basal body L-ring protein FlgH [Gallionellaceae bacterium]